MGRRTSIWFSLGTTLWGTIFSLMPVVAGETPSPPSDSKSREDPTVQVSHKSRVRLGGITVGAGYSHFSGPYYPYRYWYPYAYYPYWGPFWDSYFYHPYFAPYYPTFSTNRGAGMGEIRLQTDQKGAELYVDGAFAGLVADLKTFYLRPGAYNLEIKTLENRAFQKRIYVLSGKILKISPVFRASRAEEE
jgi:hypothetical protein